MRLKVGLVAVVCALCCLAALDGCGESATTTTKVVEVGNETVTIPTDTPKGVFAVTRALLAKTAYEPWYQRCIISQAEKLVTPAEAQKMASAPKARGDLQQEALMAKAAPACEGGHRNIIDPQASGSGLRLIRLTTARTYGIVAEKDHFTRKVGECFEQQVMGAPGRDLIEIANSTGKVQEADVEKLVESCVEAPQ